jgi:NAD(P)-dependent dehydrogenase (short-subunit alcohol dehydrogenase family)
MTKRRIVVVGASRGIGASLVKRLSSDKNNELLALARNTELLNTEFRGMENIHTGYLDLSEQVHEKATTLFETFGTIDVLINNAGYLVNKPFPELTHQDLAKSYQTNVIGVMETVQAALPFLSASGAHIVNISSMGGFQGTVKFPGLAAYSTSKAALCSFTELFAEEYKETKIRMNCLCLGAVQTEMLEEAFPGYHAPMDAHEMAEFISDFALQGHRWMNGKILPVSLSTP